MLVSMLCGTYVPSKQWFDKFAQIGPKKKVPQSARLSAGRVTHWINYEANWLQWKNYIIILNKSIYRRLNCLTAMAMEISLLPSWNLWLKRWSNVNTWKEAKCLYFCIRYSELLITTKWRSLKSTCPGWRQYHRWGGNRPYQTGRTTILLSQLVTWGGTK